jgi:hypothetical protein
MTMPVNAYAVDEDVDSAKAMPFGRDPLSGGEMRWIGVASGVFLASSFHERLLIIASKNFANDGNLL